MEMRVNSTSSTSEKWKVYTVAGFFFFFLLTLFMASNFQSSVDEISFTGDSVVVTTAAAAVTNSSSSSSSPLVQQVVISSRSSPAAGDMAVALLTTTALEEPAASSTSGYSSTSGMTSSSPPPPVARPPTSVSVSENRDEANKKSQSSCNIYEGRWVYKPTENPMYNADKCPFLTGETSCQKNGRPDSDYEGWIWEPHDCRIPLSNGKDTLEKMRGKRIIFVGDSLNRNQWLSMACLIYTSISPSRSFVKISEMYKVLKAKDYDFTLEFYWSPLLVEVDYKRKILKLDNLDPSSNQWRDADVMVFNSGHWWTHGPTMRAWDVVEYKGKLIKGIEKELAYERALSTWLTWLKNNVNQNKTTVFFRSISPEHKGKQLCFNTTSPVPDESYINGYPHSMTEVVERTIVDGFTNLFPVRYLNITSLSGYRKDAHPSHYNKKDQSHWKAMLAAEPNDINKVAKQHADCSHWCLPGVPDTWNRLIYVSLFYSRQLLME